MNAERKRLYRSRTDSRLVGVCGGLGEYLGVDPVIVRLAWVAITVLSGFLPGILTYLLAWIIVPEEPVPQPSAAPPQGASEPRS